MSKGLETRTIVLLIIGLIILGIVFGILFIGTGPFSDAAKFGKCRGQLIAYCQGTGNLKGCSGQEFGGYKPICADAGNGCYSNEYNNNGCSGITDDNKLHCCNAFK